MAKSKKVATVPVRRAATRRIGKPGASKGMKFPAEVLSDGEVLRLIAACSRRSSSGIRGRALIAVLWRSGARISEALSLRPADLDAAGGTLNVTCGKGGRQRMAAMDANAFAYVDRWMDRRRALGIRGGPLFSTLKGKAMMSAYARAWLHRVAKRAGIERRVHPHMMRHSFAAGLASEGVPMNVIQLALGHASLAVTSRYLAHVNPVQLVAAVRSRQWPTEPERTTSP
jgi:integrase/recombinase XerD